MNAEAQATAQLAAAAQITLTEPQREMLGAIFMASDDGRPAFREVWCEDLTIISVATLSWMYLSGMTVLWSGRWARGAHTAISEMIRNTFVLRDEVLKVYLTSGAEEILLRSSARLITRRTAAPGYGLAVQRLVTDDDRVGTTPPCLRYAADWQRLIARWPAPGGG